ncbi:MAG: hypothetical protein AAGA35_02255 [Patescibacteria group bacterium]
MVSQQKEGTYVTEEQRWQRIAATLGGLRIFEGDAVFEEAIGQLPNRWQHNNQVVVQPEGDVQIAFCGCGLNAQVLAGLHKQMLGVGFTDVPEAHMISVRQLCEYGEHVFAGQQSLRKAA